MIIFYLSKLWKAKFFILCDVIFLVGLQGKFLNDHSWEWKLGYNAWRMLHEPWPGMGWKYRGIGLLQQLVTWPKIPDEFLSTIIGKSIRNYVDMQNFMSFVLTCQLWHHLKLRNTKKICMGKFAGWQSFQSSNLFHTNILIQAQLQTDARFDVLMLRTWNFACLRSFLCSFRLWYWNTHWWWFFSHVTNCCKRPIMLGYSLRQLQK